MRPPLPAASPKALVGQKLAYLVVTEHQPVSGGGALYSPPLPHCTVSRIGVGQHLRRERFRRAAFHVAPFALNGQPHYSECVSRLSTLDHVVTRVRLPV